MICLTETLSDRSVVASAPHRLDVGGTWDLKALALPCEQLKPSTTNIAIGLRTWVQLRPHLPGRMRIKEIGKWKIENGKPETGKGTRETEGGYTEEFALEEVPFDSRFGLLWAIVCHLHVLGVEIQLSYEAPPRAGLGGSGTLAVAVLAALRCAAERGEEQPHPPGSPLPTSSLERREELSPPSPGLRRTQERGVGGVRSHPEEQPLSPIQRAQIVELAHQLEDGLHFSFKGSGWKRHESLSISRRIGDEATSAHGNSAEMPGSD